MTDSANQGGRAIELTKRQRARFESIKEECENDLPEPSDKTMISSLMDTWEAVDRGLYSDTNSKSDGGDR